MTPLVDANPLLDPGKRERRVSWDLVRVLAVVLVIAFHATFVAPIVEPQLQERRYSMSVQLGAASLLVISAFFVAQTLRRAPPWRFWRGRVVRMLPPFLVSVLVTWTTVQTLAPRDWSEEVHLDVVDLVGNFLMLWSVYPDQVQFVDGSYWTLPLQLLAFTAAAVLVAMRMGAGRSLRVVLWTAAIVPIAHTWLRDAHPPEWYRLIADTTGFHRVHLFVLGVGLWLWAERRLSHRHALALGTTCLVAHALTASQTTVPGPALASTVGLGLMMLLLAVTARGPDWGRFLPVVAQRTIRWLAGISYGTYLLHQTIGMLVMRRVHDAGGDQRLEVIAMVLTAILLGWLLTTLVERPVARFADGRPSRPGYDTDNARGVPS